MAEWLEYTIWEQWVVGLNPRRVNGGDRMGIQPWQDLPINQGEISMTPHRGADSMTL